MRAAEIWEKWFLHSQLGPSLGPGRARRRLAELIEIRDRLIELATIAPTADVLDVGCGTGLLTFPAADHAGAAFGVDLDEAVLHDAVGVPAIGAAFARADAAHLPFADESFDVVVWRSLLVYAERRDAIVSEARRVLRPDGRLAFSESLTKDMSVPMKDATLGDLWNALHEIANAALGSQALDAKGLEHLVESAGFTGAHCRTERRRTTLEDERAVHEIFDSAPPGGLSLAGLWVEAGVKPELVGAFLHALIAQTPMQIDTPEGYLTAAKA